MELVVDGDQVLRIVGRGVRGLRGRAGQVAEAEQCGLLLGADVLPRRGRRPAHRRAACADGGHAAPLLREPVVQFLRIARQVVELRDRQLDDFSAAVDDADERRPAAIERRGERFEVACIRGSAARRRATGRAAPAARRRRRARGSSARCRCGGHSALSTAARCDGSSDEQRHLQRRLVGEEAVRLLAVIAEGLAVIAGDDHQRVRRGLAAADRAYAPASRPSRPPRRGTSRRGTASRNGGGGRYGACGS